MISFLAALPHPSLIFIGDVINAHNIKGFSRNPKKPPSDEKALEMAMEESQPLREVISTAIENLEKEPDTAGKVMMRPLGVLINLTSSKVLRAETGRYPSLEHYLLPLQSKDTFGN